MSKNIQQHHVIRCIIIHMHIQQLALAPERCLFLVGHVVSLCRHDGATSLVVCAPSPSSSYTYVYSVDMFAQGIKVSFHLLGQNTLKLLVP